MNLTCFYCQTPFTLSMDQKIAALRKMHAENLHHYDAHCPRCGRANAISRERLEMFTPGWEEAIKAPAAESGAPVRPAMPPAPAPASSMSTPSMGMGMSEPRTAPAPAMKKEAAPTRRRHAPAAKKAARKAVAKRKPVAKKAPARKKAVKKSTKAKTKSAARKKTRAAAKKTKKR